MFLVVKGACAVVGYVPFHLERDIPHIPKSIARILVNNVEQALVVCVVASLRIVLPKLVT